MADALITAAGPDHTTSWPAVVCICLLWFADTLLSLCPLCAGRNILDHAALREQGFIVYALGKPLDPFLRNP